MAAMSRERGTVAEAQGSLVSKASRHQHQSGSFFGPVNRVTFTSQRDDHRRSQLGVSKKAAGANACGSGHRLLGHGFVWGKSLTNQPRIVLGVAQETVFI